MSNKKTNVQGVALIAQTINGVDVAPGTVVTGLTEGQAKSLVEQGALDVDSAAIEYWSAEGKTIDVTVKAAADVTDTPAGA